MNTDTDLEKDNIISLLQHQYNVMKSISSVLSRIADGRENEILALQAREQRLRVILSTLSNTVDHPLIIEALEMPNDCTALQKYLDESARVQLRPDIFRELVNELKHTSLMYHDHQSLRERISNVVSKYVKASE
jgi:hypothetical protein